MDRKRNKRILPLGSMPRNEMGVVYLFADYARRHKLQVKSVQSGFPDAIVTRRTAKGEEEFRIEFEFRARTFKAHRHDPREVDWVVCWENNWSDAPKNLRIIALNEDYGYGRNVYLQYMPYGAAAGLQARQERRCRIDARARPGDLMLLHSSLTYEACKELGLGREEGHESRLFAVARVIQSGRQQSQRAQMARIKCEIELTPFVALQADILDHPSLRLEFLSSTAKVTEYWDEIRRRIVSKRPRVRASLEKLG